MTVQQEAFLRANGVAYDRLVQAAGELWRSGHAEAALGAVSRAAVFCCAFHAGRFADGAIENIAFEIGSTSPHAPAATIRSGTARLDGRRRVLHVLSQVSGIGGHTRMLYHWMRHDRSSLHCLAVVRQGARPVPRWLSDAVHAAGGDLTLCDPRSPQHARAAAIRRIAQHEVDLVVLHHDGGDVVPTVAFAADGPPVAVLNHADHAFWLGSSVADAVINLRSAACGHAAERRFARRNAVLPIPLTDTPVPLARADARRLLGIPAEQRMLLTIGRSMKYRPCGTYDFIGTARKILERNRSTHLYVVGANGADMAPYIEAPRHERIHFVGAMEDSSAYRAAADIYLEPFPFGSNTASLEAALAGLPVVPAYSPLFPLLVAGNDSLQDLLSNPPSEDAYIARVGELARDAAQRVEFGAALRNKVLSEHVGQGWLDRLASLYRCTDALVHRPAPIPATTCSTSDADIGLSLWNVMADGRTNYRAGVSRDPGALLRHAAFVSKDTGDYASARRLAARAVLAGPADPASWRLLCVSALGRWGPVARSWLRRTDDTVME